jgi:hypothetical protein
LGVLRAEAEVLGIVAPWSSIVAGRGAVSPQDSLFLTENHPGLMLDASDCEPGEGG